MSQPDLMRAEYDALPDAIKSMLSFTEYRWLSGAERAQLLQSETEPDTYD